MDPMSQQEILDAVFELDSELLEPFNTDDNVERCALLLGHRERGHYVIQHVVEVSNDTDNPTDSFQIRRSQVNDVLSKHSGVLLGVLHTHHNTPAYPSTHDVKSIPLGMLGIVYHTKTRTITYYNRHGYISEAQL